MSFKQLERYAKLKQFAILYPELRSRIIDIEFFAVLNDEERNQHLSNLENTLSKLSSN